MVMSPRYTFQQAVKIAGSQSKLGDMLGVSRQAVAQWKESGHIPEVRAWRLHQILKEQSE